LQRTCLISEYLLRGDGACGVLCHFGLCISAPPVVVLFCWQLYSSTTRTFVSCPGLRTPKMPTSPPSFLVRLCGVGRGCCPQQRGGARNGCILRPSTRDGLQSFPDLHRRRLPASCPGNLAATLHDVGCTDSLAAPHHRHSTCVLSPGYKQLRSRASTMRRIARDHTSLCPLGRSPTLHRRLADA